MSCSTRTPTVLPAAAAEFTLKYGHVGPVESDDQIPGEFLKAFLSSRSNGRIDVEIYPASQLGNFRDMIEQVQLNTLELTHTTVGGMARPSAKTVGSLA